MSHLAVTERVLSLAEIGPCLGGALIVAGLAWVSASAAGAEGPPGAPGSPHRALRPVGLDEAHWTSGFWAEKFELCHTAMIPSIERALLDPDNSEQLRNLRLAAGLEEGAHQGTDWSDGDCYKWLEAMAIMCAVTEDPTLEEKLDEWIAVIEKAQTPAGYLSTNIGDDPSQWLRMPYRHEMYNMGHLLHAAAIHHRATGKHSFLRIARKLADFLWEQFSPRPPRLVHFPWNPSAYMGLIELYRTTGERYYLDLAQILIGNRGSSPGGGDHRNGGTDQTQDRVPIREETEAVGHAVCATYLYCGATDLYAETGDDALRAGLERIWQSVTARRMYVTGAVGSGGGTSSRGDPVHEAFLADYELPSRSAYAETCSNIGNAMWNWRMLGISGDAKYADIMELVLYNSALSAVSIDGERFFYCNPLKWTGEQSGPANHHTAARWHIHSCYCCPPQVARTVAGLHTWAYSRSDEGIWINLYGGSALRTRLPDGSTVALEQETDYPWDGRVRVTLTEAPDPEFALMLRIPGWAEGAELRVNDERQDCDPGTYAAVRRAWRAGDAIELELPMRVRLIEANPAVAELRNYVAVMRGPVVYCLELPVDGGGAETWERGVFLPENTEFEPRFEKNLLGGVVTLSGQGLTFEGRDQFVRETAATVEVQAERPWGDALYRELGPRPLPDPTSGTVDITLIPYFAWANRGVSFMEVWIPLAR